MSTAKYVGRVGALAVALGVGFAVATTPAVAYAEPADSSRCSSFDSPSPDSTALIMGGTTIPTPDATSSKLSRTGTSRRHIRARTSTTAR